MVMMKTDKKIDTYFYIVGLCLIGILAVYYFISTRFGDGFLHFSYPCMLHELTGYYCPGCGGTRAVFYLMAGKVMKSFLAHPIVVYTALIGGWFMISQSLQHISYGRLSIGLHFRPLYLWIALVLTAGNWIVKNLVLYFWQIDLLAR